MQLQPAGGCFPSSTKNHPKSVRNDPRRALKMTIPTTRLLEIRVIWKSQWIYLWIHPEIYPWDCPQNLHLQASGRPRRVGEAKTISCPEKCAALLFTTPENLSLKCRDPCRSGAAGAHENQTLQGLVQIWRCRCSCRSDAAGAARSAAFAVRPNNWKIKLLRDKLLQQPAARSLPRNTILIITFGQPEGGLGTQRGWLINPLLRGCSLAPKWEINKNPHTSRRGHKGVTNNRAGVKI